ncbi:MAG: aldehyde dehydrogenase [Acidimicrobiia bacterium]|nr:aldehyde dehydrogenase [Acidimicrobiia bacterium]
MTKLQSLNPSKNYELIGEVEMSYQADVKNAVLDAKSAQKMWSDLSIEQRCAHIKDFTDICEKHSADIAQLMILETGRSNSSALDNVQGGIDFFNKYIDTAPDFFKPKITFENEKEIHRVFQEPYGVVAAICPWNYPFMNVAWQCGQSLLAGNTIVYKNSQENPLFAKYLKELIEQSTMPKGVFNILIGDAQVGKWMIREEIDFISFTGSTNTGKELTKIAADKFIPIISELGGSAPLVIFDDIQVNDELIEHIWSRRFSDAGQSCDAVKRLIVHEDIYDDIVSRLIKLISSKKIGDPSDDSNDMGPLISSNQLQRLEDQVQDAKVKGAKIEIGGERPELLKGAYFLPTIITDVVKEMKIWHEEVFGPVLPIVSFKSDDEAINLANDTIYGLGAHVMTKDKDRFNKLAKEIKSGMIGQNTVMFWGTENPFGGYKQSGMGRVHGDYGFSEVTQVKLICEEKQ